MHQQTKNDTVMKFNVFEYAAKEERLFEANVEQTGYKRITTFYSDLSIAEWYDEKSVEDTYRNICKVWINDYKYFTEFVMCLNIKSWEHDARGNAMLSRLYSDLYYHARDLFYTIYNGNDKKDKEARDYFFNTTD